MTSNLTISEDGSGSEGHGTTARVHSIVSGLSGFLTILAMVLYPLGCRKTICQWLGQYAVEVRQVSITSTSESVVRWPVRTSSVERVGSILINREYEHVNAEVRAAKKTGRVYIRSDAGLTCQN